MCISFVLLAFSTAFDIVADKGGKAGPPEFGSDELMGFKETRVTSRFVIMALFEDGAVERVISRDVNTAFVG